MTRDCPVDSGRGNLLVKRVEMVFVRFAAMGETFSVISDFDSMLFRFRFFTPRLRAGE